MLNRVPLIQQGGAVPEFRRFSGTRIKRREDPRLLTGRGAFIADICLPNMAEVAFVRSPLGHAEIKSIDTREAELSQGVLAVVTGADLVAESAALEATLHEVPGLEHMARECKKSKWYPLALERVRYMGEAVVAIAAENRYLAEDAAEKVMVNYNPLPVVTNVADSLDQDAPLLHEEWGENLILKNTFKNGDPVKAFEDAPVIIKETFDTNRCTGLSLETRGGVAEYDPFTKKLTFWTSSQIPHMVRMILPDLIGVPESHLHVITPDVGGGFGTKGQVYPEDVALIVLAKRLNRPVRWIEDRFENLIAASHAREGTFTVEIAANKDGEIVGLRGELFHDAGAYLSFPYGVNESIHTGMVLPGPYRIRNYEYTMYTVATNKTPLGPYRGVGAPMATYIGEHLIDCVARELDLDPIDIRLRNLVREEEFPYTSITGLVLENGSYIESVEKCREWLDLDNFRLEQKLERKKGRYIGVGISCYVEGAAPGSPFFALWNASGFETVTVRLTPSAKIIVESGMSCQGQGYETTLAQVVADELEVDMEDVSVSLGDTTNSPFSWGSHSSRFMVACGGACLLALRDVKDSLLRVAANSLEVEVGDLEFRNGSIGVVGAPEKALRLEQVCRFALVRTDLWPDSTSPIQLEATRTYEPPPLSTPNATHAVVVEVDAETGEVKILRYLVVHDCGKIINPMIVEGQIRGGTVQGIGNAICEHLPYGKDGQMKAGSLMDYVIPTTKTSPNIDVIHIETPSRLALNGCKGMGEGGAIAGPSAIANGVADALSHLGVRVTKLPITPERVWTLIQEAENKGLEQA